MVLFVLNFFFKLEYTPFFTPNIIFGLLTYPNTEQYFSKAFIILFQDKFVWNIPPNPLISSWNTRLLKLPILLFDLMHTKTQNSTFQKFYYIILHYLIFILKPFFNLVHIFFLSQHYILTLSIPQYQVAIFLRLLYHCGKCSFLNIPPKTVFQVGLHTSFHFQLYFPRY